MSIVEPSWWAWRTIGEDGFFSGLREDTPDEIKEEYEKFEKVKKEYPYIKL